MALREIIILPDARLRQVSAPIDKVDSEIRKLADDMFETMYEAPGIGLAAIQITIPKRILVIDLARKEEPKNPRAFINPTIRDFSENLSVYEEGCLSIPEYYAEVERPAELTVDYFDLEGKAQSLRADGLLATCLQHEIDHLNGKLSIDYLSKLKRNMVIKKYTKQANRES